MTLNAINTDSLATMAAIVADDSQAADRIIDTVIVNLQQEHFKIAGLRQAYLSGEVSNGGCGVQLRNIATGQLHSITQDLGSGSTSCNIDTDAMARLVEIQSTEMCKGTDLIIVNRYGKRESESDGFCVVFERALELGIPVLTVVKQNWLDTWLSYGGECVTCLNSDSDDVLSWCRSVIGK